MRKDSSVGDILRAGQLLHAAGIELGVFVMLGYPGEGRREVDATIAMLHALQPEVTLVSVAHPMKGTAFYDEVAHRLEETPDAQDGRLAFRMPLPRPYYELAQRLIWAETRLVRKLKQGEYDRELALLAVKAPALRAGSRLAARGWMGR